jgi:hypothetical protein
MVYEHEIDKTQQTGFLKAEDWFGKSENNDKTSIKKPAVFKLKKRQKDTYNPDKENCFIRIKPSDIEERNTLLSKIAKIVLKWWL